MKTSVCIYEAKGLSCNVYMKKNEIKINEFQVYGFVEKYCYW